VVQRREFPAIWRSAKQTLAEVGGEPAEGGTPHH
jgi:hypothetical protein